MIKSIKFQSILLVAKEHIVEMLLFVALFVSSVFCDFGEKENNFIALAYIAPILTYSFNKIFRKRRFRFIYYIGWIFVYLSIFLISDKDWHFETQAVIIRFVLLPLLIVIGQRNLCNRDFVKGVVNFVISLFITALFSGIIILLLYLICWSIEVIFSYSQIFRNWSNLSVFIFCIISPLLFFYYSTFIFYKSRISSMLINYILSPAILIYAAMLYLTIFKALWARELPEGGVAYLVFGFVIIALVVRSLRETVDVKVFSWFFDNFSLIAIPILILFWVGVSERISQYGLTEWRVYLVICGAIMSLCVFMFLSKRYASYFALTLFVFMLSCLVAFVPNLSAEAISYKSQYNRAVRYLEKLEFIDSHGRIITSSQITLDSTQIKESGKLKEAVDYVFRRDKSAFREFGVNRKSQIVNILYKEEVVQDFNNKKDISLNLSKRHKKIDISGYNYIYSLDYDKNNFFDNCYNCSDSALNIYIDDKLYTSIGFDRLIGDRINKSIKEHKLTRSTLENLTRYNDGIEMFKNDSLIIILNNVSINYRDNDKVATVKYVKLDRLILK